MRNNKGFVKLIILIIIGIAILSYFNIDIRSILDSNSFRDNLSYVWNFIWNIWSNYIKGPFVFLLNWILGKIN